VTVPSKHLFVSHRNQKPRRRLSSAAVVLLMPRDNMARLILENGVTHVVHLATLLSAVGERNPALALKVNIHGCQVRRGARARCLPLNGRPLPAAWVLLCFEPLVCSF